MARKAVVLLSGGLDSATVLAIVKAEGLEPLALSFDYGQRHRAELDAAKRIAAAAGVPRHETVTMDLRVFGGSALTDDIAVPTHDDADDIGEGIPVTYVPARNTIFLAYALAFAEVTGAHDIFIGVNALDYSGYPDCRPEYIDAFQAMARLATKEGVEGRQPMIIQTPLIDMTKAEIIRKGVELGVDFAETVSCYDPDDSGAACGRCDACLLRRRGFEEAEVADPTRYR